jgi:hypothetical protein
VGSRHEDRLWVVHARRLGRDPKIDIFGPHGIGVTVITTERTTSLSGLLRWYLDTLREHGPCVAMSTARGFYNFAVTGWSQVSAHFQFIDPFAVASETRGFFSVRWKLTF